MNRQMLLDRATDTVLTQMFFAELPSATEARAQMDILRQAALEDPQGSCYENELDLDLSESNLNSAMGELVTNVDYHISVLVDFGAELLALPAE